ncbi:hypothetical protein G4B88_010196 [Cannabis sativa]|uniref:DNA-directed RNA polymerase n=1 Tax=Cannabis sativa TaxID=3483 RepID=A0A7J6I574_CANSA|nr:hypothetical protein G4B88_010196 [Cannabis sativa]
MTKKTQNFVNNAESITHVWYLKCLPSYIANLYDNPLKELEGLVYYDNEKLLSHSIELGCPIFDMSLVKSNMKLRIIGRRDITVEANIPHFFYYSWLQRFFKSRNFYREQLADLDLGIIIDYSSTEWKELGEEGPTGNEWEDRKVGRRKDFSVRRIELAKHFIRTNIEPEWMVLCLLQVLPLELRPIIQTDGGRLMSLDINELYRRVIYRNNTLIDLLTTSRSTLGELVMC